MKSPMRVLTLLLVICSISVPTAAVFTGYFFFQNQEIENLKIQLLSENELQAQLVNAQPLEKSLVPHLVDDIGYVLNPHMERSAFRAHEDDSYPVNSLGLRGQEITTKKEGAIRILIVGDSLVFGWKLLEKDRLSNVLNKYASKINTAKKKVEFFTIALPGWNVKSERAFLESHLRLLDPDLVIWWTIPNDVEDVAGAIPPGILARWASPQDKDQSPFIGLSNFQKRSGSFMPLIADRRNENIELIKSFQLKYDIPVLLIASPSLLDYSQALFFDGKQIFIPQKYRQDQRWKLSASDGHPSPWANNIIALGVLSKLIRSELIPAIEFGGEDLEIVQNFSKLDAITKPKKIGSDFEFSNTLAQIPIEYKHDEINLRRSVLYGVTPDGIMAKSGALFLRDPVNSSHISISIRPPINIDKYPGTAKFTVRNRNYEETHTNVNIDKKNVTAVLELPIEQSNSPVYEVSWNFDFSLCTSPSSCSVGTLIYAGFQQ